MSTGDPAGHAGDPAATVRQADTPDRRAVAATRDATRLPTRLPARLIDLGHMGYREAHARQLDALEQRKADRIPDTLLFVEHPHVITLGRKHTALANVVAAGEVEVIQVERGGDVTYHGPGQLVAYPIVKLGEGERDLHRFLRNLEAGMIRTLARHGIAAGREDGKTGVWLPPGGRARRAKAKKIASIGIACRRWVTFHGLALNVTTDLSYFHRINPCGFDAAVMTSMALETGRDLDLAEVKRQLADDLGHALARAFTVAGVAT